MKKNEKKKKERKPKHDKKSNSGEKGPFRKKMH